MLNFRGVIREITRFKRRSRFFGHGCGLLLDLISMGSSSSSNLEAVTQVSWGAKGQKFQTETQKRLMGWWVDGLMAHGFDGLIVLMGWWFWWVDSFDGLIISSYFYPKQVMKEKNSIQAAHHHHTHHPSPPTSVRKTFDVHWRHLSEAKSLCEPLWGLPRYVVNNKYIYIFIL